MGRFQINAVKSFLKTHRIYIETGSLHGEGVERALPYFDLIYTIELDSKLHEAVSKKFASDSKVHCLQGDSKEVLKELLPNLPVDSAAIFFLDAHWSGDASVDWDSSLWKGRVQSAYVGDIATSENQVPLKEELEAIVSLYQGPAIIYIDDMDKFDDKGQGMKNFKFIGEDWTHLTIDILKATVKPRLKTWTPVDDEQVLIELFPVISDEKESSRVAN
jgi:hypothetical protein